MGVRVLTPGNMRIFLGEFSLLHCEVEGDELFRGVFAMRLFPVNHPERYLSLNYTNEEDKVREVGVIEDLQAFPEDARRLIRASLRNYYHEQMVFRIWEVKVRWGYLFLDVETESGRQEVIMPWRYDRAEEYGQAGRVLLDALDNRYVVPDVDALPPRDRDRFRQFIYW